MKRPLVALGLLASLTLALIGVGAAAGSASPRPAVLPQAIPTLPTPPLPLPSDSPSPSGSPTSTPGTPGGGKPPCPKTSGTTITFCYEYGTDRTSWYWRDQKEQNVPGTGENLRLQNPQADDTLPVTAQGGDLNRISAIYFDVELHGVPDGATISKFVLTLQEGTEQNQGAEQPEYNMQGKVILACPISTLWATGAAELWEQKPTYDEAKCVESKHDATAIPPTWTWDLTSVAAKWAIDPFLNNNGIALVPKIIDGKPDTQQYQVNLKIPARDDTKTPTIDEYDRTAERAVVTLTYVKPAPSTTTSAPPTTAPPTTSPPLPPAPPPPPAGGGDSNISGGPPIGGGGGFTPPTGGTTITGGPSTQPSASPEPSPTTQPTQLASPPPVPAVKAPWYVWVLFPVGLLALAAMRSVLFEQARAGIRPNGVIAAIRARNGAAGAAGGAMSGIVARARGLKEGLQGKSPSS